MTDKKTKASEPVEEKASKPAEDALSGRKRPTRITRDMLVNKGPLVVPESFKKAGMVNFWMMDSPHNFEKYQRLGYDFATNDKGEKCSVGRSGETTYLLEIPKELHDDILAVKHELRLEKTAERRGINNPRQQGQTEGIFEDTFTLK